MKAAHITRAAPKDGTIVRENLIKLAEALCTFDAAIASLSELSTAHAEVVTHALGARQVMTDTSSVVLQPIKSEFYNTQPYKLFPEESKQFLPTNLPKQVLNVLAASPTPLLRVG